MKLHYGLLLAFCIIGGVSAFDSFDEAFAAGIQAQKEGRLEQAVIYFKQAEDRATTPDEKYKVLITRANHYRAEKEWVEAERTLEKIIKAEGMDPVLVATARIHQVHNIRFQGKLPEAAAAYIALGERADLPPGIRANALLDAGVLLRSMNKPDEALAPLRKVESIPGAPVNFVADAGVAASAILIDQKKYGEAEKTVEKVLSLKGAPVYAAAAAIFNRGRLYFEQQRYPESIAAYRQVYELKGASQHQLRMADLYIADNYFAQKDWKLAGEYYEKAARSPFDWCVRKAKAQLEKIQAMKDAE